MIDALLARPEDLFQKGLVQIIGFCGKGKLRDGSDASTEFRKVLAAAPRDVLEGYAAECLDSGFRDSGLALQDVMNELASRLGFDVTFGRYRGKKNSFAPDGAWVEPRSGFALVVEVKTTDAYRISLDRLDQFRRATCIELSIPEADSSTLIIVGREDTGELEAQIRGSRHAWSTRLVSVESLFNVHKLIETVDEEETIARVCEVLRPREYTRVDGIIELAFAAAQDALDAEQSESQPVPSSDPIQEAAAAAKEAPGIDKDQRRADGAAAVAANRGLALHRKSRTLWASSTGVAVLVMYSKFHERASAYWFAFHERQNTKMAEAAPGSLIALVCGEVGVVLLQYTDLVLALPHLHTTDPKKGRLYWHLKIKCQDGRPSYFVGKEGVQAISVSEFVEWPDD